MLKAEKSEKADGPATALTVTMRIARLRNCRGPFVAILARATEDKAN